MAAPDIALARATIHLPGGLAPGFVYWVDANEVYVKECLHAGHLVLEPSVSPQDAPGDDDDADPDTDVGDGLVGAEK